MALTLYNTLTRREEPFVPADPDRIRMYVCGVTVYDHSHIGHARVYIVFDTLFRLLKRRFPSHRVEYVRNFTDIDDKIIRRAAEAGCDIHTLTGRFIDEYHKDMDALGLCRPTHEPKATEYVEAMVAFIGRLIDKGAAYATAAGDVYFRVASFPTYGQLSRKNVDELLAGASGRMDEETARGKEAAVDFALWKAAKPGEPAWPSPWGQGRPGWHIECSVMSTSLLGDTLDIHAGGKDLQFPHHENEIAQSESHTGKPFSRFWLHNGFINVPDRADTDSVDGVKMSKSLGNFWTVKDALALYHPEAVKLLMHQTHYRKDLLFDEAALKEAQGRLTYFYETLRKIGELLASRAALGEGGGDDAPDPVFDTLPAAFDAAMDEDLNTPAALAALSEPFQQANRLLMAKGKGVAAKSAAQLRRFLAVLAPVKDVFGILQGDPEAELRRIQDLRLRALPFDRAFVEGKIADRTDARARRDFAAADAIRDDLLSKGIELMDGAHGTRWMFKEGG